MFFCSFLPYIVNTLVVAVLLLLLIFYVLFCFVLFVRSIFNPWCAHAQRSLQLCVYYLLPVVSAESLREQNELLRQTVC